MRTVMTVNGVAGGGGGNGAAAAAAALGVVGSLRGR